MCLLKLLELLLKLLKDIGGEGLRQVRTGSKKQVVVRLLLMKVYFKLQTYVNHQFTNSLGRDLIITDTLQSMGPIS